MITQPCAHCGTGVTRDACSFKRRENTFCSRACYFASKRAATLAVNKAKPCALCGGKSTYVVLRGKKQLPTSLCTPCKKLYDLRQA